jgi:hypothetical protein
MISLERILTTTSDDTLKLNIEMMEAAFPSLKMIPTWLS